MNNNLKLKEFLLLGMNYEHAPDETIITLTIMDLQLLKSFKVKDRIPDGLVDIAEEKIKENIGIYGANRELTINGVYRYSMNLKEIAKDYRIPISPVDDVRTLKTTINRKAPLYFNGITNFMNPNQITSINDIMIIPNMEIRQHYELIETVRTIERTLSNVNEKRI